MSLFLFVLSHESVENVTAGKYGVTNTPTWDIP